MEVDATPVTPAADPRSTSPLAFPSSSVHPSSDRDNLPRSVQQLRSSGTAGACEYTLTDTELCIVLTDANVYPFCS